MSIADKLLYLNETKTALRDAINLRGGDIATGDTFRSYVNQLQQLIWMPDALFANGEQGAWYDPSDLSTLFQDAAGTVPVTADGDPVGLMLDKSGNGNHASQAVSASRPVYRTDGTLHWLEFDGVDDQLSAAGTVSASQSSAAWLAFTPRSTSSYSRFFTSLADGSSVAGQITFRREGTDNRLSVISAGSTIEGYSFPLENSQKYIASARYDYARVNGSENSTLTTAVNSAVNSGLYIGSRGGASYSNMYFYGAILSDFAPQGDAEPEQYLASLAGVTL